MGIMGQCYAHIRFTVKSNVGLLLCKNKSHCNCVHIYLGVNLIELSITYLWMRFSSIFPLGSTMKKSLHSIQNNRVWLILLQKPLPFFRLRCTDSWSILWVLHIKVGMVKKTTFGITMSGYLWRS